jgi:signal transduction histidine kinase
MLRIGISRDEIENRVGILRRDLMTQAALVGVVTLLLLVGVTSLLWWLWRRSRRLEEQAAEAESMAVIGTLASGLAHEIRNPLNALNLNMQLLDEELPAGSSQRRMLGITRDEIHRLERLVTDFLLYAKPRRLERSGTPAAELFAACGELLEPELRRRGARLEFIDRTGGELLDIDREQLQQLLINLVQNALLASREDEEHPVIELVAEHQDGQVVLAVKDQGVGMESHERDQIFEAFFSTRRGGTGLGLAVVQRIARAHGAEVEVESAPGAGTTIRVRLPRSSGAPETAVRQ